VSLRWRIALGFALVALATAAVIALAAPPIILQGFSDYDSDNDGGQPIASTRATPAGENETGDGAAAVVTLAPVAPGPAAPTNNPKAQQDTIVRLILAAIAAAAVASLFGLIRGSKRPQDRSLEAT
jgi:hypothetical protein